MKITAFGWHMRNREIVEHTFMLFVGITVARRLRT